QDVPVVAEVLEEGPGSAGVVRAVELLRAAAREYRPEARRSGLRARELGLVAGDGRGADVRPRGAEVRALEEARAPHQVQVRAPVARHPDVAGERPEIVDLLEARQRVGRAIELVE